MLLGNAKIDIEHDEPKVIGDIIRAFLTDRGHKKRSHSRLVSEILGLTPTQSQRKLEGKSSWDTVQIKQIADFFEQPKPKSPFDFHEKIVDGFFIVGDKEIPCNAWLGLPLHNRRHATYVAYKVGDEAWRVTNASYPPADIVCYKVKKIEIKQEAQATFCIAILDDENDSADQMCHQLNSYGGFIAKAYYSPEQLAKAMSHENFDGYIIDWGLANETAEQTIRLIRSNDESAPIFLITGRLASGETSQSEVANAVVQYDLSWKEKPTRMEIIAAELTKELDIY